MLNLKNPDRTIRVGVILMNSTTEILDVAPIDILHGLNKSFIQEWPDIMLPSHLKEQAVPLEFHWVSETGETPSRLTSGINLVPTDSFETCPPLDIVLIGANTAGYVLSEAELSFIRKSWEDCTAFLTICAGVEPALQAGILQGKTATGPRPILNLLRQQAPGTKWVEKRWVRDGKLWTSGALLNGLDLMNAFVNETWGGEGSLIERLSRLGALPARDVDYKDVAWDI